MWERLAMVPENREKYESKKALEVKELGFPTYFSR